MLSRRELATVLAALRHWQRYLATDGSAASADSFQFDETTLLSIEELDTLCERLNAEPAPDDSELCDGRQSEPEWLGQNRR
jgi:hypothetical protein